MFPTMNLRSRGDEEDKTSSSYFPPSSNDTYFTEQAFRAGFMRNDEIRRRRRSEFLLRNSDPVREAIVIELEKEKIKQEIMATEIIRKRTLDAEIAMGRDLSIQPGFSSMLAEPPRVPFAHHHHPNDSRFEERFSRFPSGPEVGISERFSFIQPQYQETNWKIRDLLRNENVRIESSEDLGRAGDLSCGTD